MTNTHRQHQARILRIFRKVHRTTGALLFIFFFFVSVTGLLLGWKKNSGGYLLAKTHNGTSTDFKDWLPLDSLHARATQIFRDSISKDAPSTVDRVDVRKDKGMVKFTFLHHYWGVQLDGATGELLHLERRRADFVEHLHDASFFDAYFGFSSQPIKLIYTTVMGVALLIFTITGFWLWYGPKLMRKNAG